MTMYGEKGKDVPRRNDVLAGRGQELFPDRFFRAGILPVCSESPLHLAEAADGSTVSGRKFGSQCGIGRSAFRRTKRYACGCRDGRAGGKADIGGEIAAGYFRESCRHVTGVFQQFMVECQRDIAPCGITGRGGGDIGSFRFQAENRPDRTECLRIGFESCRLAFFFRYGGPVQKAASAPANGIRVKRLSGLNAYPACTTAVPDTWASSPIRAVRALEPIETGTVRQQPENRGGYVLFAGRCVFGGWDICFFPK